MFTTSDYLTIDSRFLEVFARRLDHLRQLGDWDTEIRVDGMGPRSRTFNGPMHIVPAICRFHIKL